MKNLYILLLLCCSIVLQAQQKIEIVSPTPEQYAKTINTDDLRILLNTLAADDMEGRETGTDGQIKAAEFIAEQFRALGLPTVGENDTYFQKMVYSSESWDSVAISANGKDYRHLWDFYSFATKNKNLSTASMNSLTFVGYGIESDNYNDYKSIDIKGKNIIMYGGEPTDERGNSILTGTKSMSVWTTDVDAKLRLAKEKGANFVFIIDPKIKKNISENRRFLLGRGMSIGDLSGDKGEYPNHAFISSTMAKQIMGKKTKKVIKFRDKAKRKGGAKAFSFSTDIDAAQRKNNRQLIGSNVLGYIEGIDPNLKDELVVITAHYDHIGKRGKEIFNGADDNGSGTSTVIEIAQALAMAKDAGDGPRRSVLCMLVSGEEKGLLGSKFYTEFPVFPLENTVANINVDMVGRVDKKHADKPEYIYVIGSDRLSTELHEINENANQKYTNLELDYTYNAEDDPNRYYYRSDHYNFAEKGIPAIFYFNGTHADYHQPSDTVDKIKFDKMAKIGQLVFYTAWELANRDARIKVDVPQKE